VLAFGIFRDAEDPSSQLLIGIHSARIAPPPARLPASANVRRGTVRTRTQGAGLFISIPDTATYSRHGRESWPKPLD
jgi:hypothetical protein